VNLKPKTSYAPLLILVAIVATMVDHFALGGFGWLTVAACVVGGLSVLYLLGRALLNWIGDIRADRDAALARIEADRQAREQLQARILGKNAQQVQNARRTADERTAQQAAEQMRQRHPDATE
jgi:hypothetical protein